jgi:hypothetical protein
MTMSRLQLAGWRLAGRWELVVGGIRSPGTKAPTTLETDRSHPRAQKSPRTWSGVVAAKHLEARPLPQRHLLHVRHQIVGDAGGWVEKVRAREWGMTD